MYEDQSGEFVWGSWGLKGLTSDTSKTFSKINSAIKSDMVVRIEAAEFFPYKPYLRIKGVCLAMESVVFWVLEFNYL